MSTVTEETEKYPRNIQKLFKPSLPPPHYDASDFPPQYRKTKAITPIAHHKSHIKEYLDQLPDLQNKPKPLKTRLQTQIENGVRKRAEKTESFKRQMADWNNPEVILQHEREISKDPYKTVFIARLDYRLTEVDLSPYFTKYGPIDSVKIIRNIKTNKSKGYGFVVFEKDTDAEACIAELAATGLKISPEYRTVLVDMERSRIVRNWTPRRLGGGLGGRHYTKPNLNLKGSSNSSAAASGRRLNLSVNPYDKKPPSSNFSPSYPQTSSYSQTSYSSQSFTPSYPPQTAFSSSQTAFSSDPAYQRPPPKPKPASIRDKYDKYAKYSR